MLSKKNYPIIRFIFLYCITYITKIPNCGLSVSKSLTTIVINVSLIIGLTGDSLVEAPSDMNWTVRVMICCEVSWVLIAFLLIAYHTNRTSGWHIYDRSTSVVTVFTWPITSLPRTLTSALQLQLQILKKLFTED